VHGFTASRRAAVEIDQQNHLPSRGATTLPWRQ
jgi:hypothetical protein